MPKIVYNKVFTLDKSELVKSHSSNSTNDRSEFVKIVSSKNTFPKKNP